MKYDAKGYSQTMPRNMSLAVVASSHSQAAYGNLSAKRSSSQQQQQIARLEKQQRSVSPDLVSKKQTKEQIGLSLETKKEEKHPILDIAF